VATGRIISPGQIVHHRAAKRIFGPKGKRKLGRPSSNSPNNDSN